MARPVAQYEIRADDQTKSAVSSATSNVEGMAKSAVSSALKMAAGFVTATVSIQKFVEFTKKSLSAYAGVQKAQIQLAASSLNNQNATAKSTRALIAYANQLEDTTGIDKAATMAQLALLNAMQLTDKQMRDVTAAAADVAASGLMGYEEAVQALAKTYSGTLGTLGKVIPATKDLTDAQLKSGAAVDMVAKRYKGMAAAVAGSSSGLSTMWDNTWGDFFEGVGKALAPLQKAVILKLKPILDQINKWITDNGNAITNVFLYLPELAQVSLSFVEKAFRNAFSFEQIINNIVAAMKHVVNVVWACVQLIGSVLLSSGKTILQTFVTLLQTFGTVMNAVGKTIWAPLSYGFDYAIYGIQVGWRAMVEGLATAINWLVNKPINSISQAFADVINFIAPGINSVISGIVSVINVAIAGANELSTLFKNIATHGVDFKSWEKATPGKGAITAPTMTPMTIPTIVSDIKPKWEKALSPPDNHIGEDVFAAWKDVGSDLGSTWDQFLSSTGDIWAGFDQDLLNAFKDVWSSTVGVMDNAVKPWEQAFAEVVPKFRDILGRALPLELQDSVDTIIAKIDAVKPKGWAGFVARISAFFKGLTSGVSNMITNFVPNLAKFGKGLLDGAIEMGKAMIHPIDSIKKWFEANKDKIGDAGLAIIDPSDATKKAATDLATSALNGLASVTQWLVNQLLNLIVNTQTFQDMLSFMSTALSSIVNGAIQPLITAIQPLINILLVFIGYIAQAILPIFQMLGTLILAIMPIFVAIGNIILLVVGIFDQFAPIIFVIAELIASILTPILNAIMPILQLFGVILTALMPLILFLAKVIDVLSRPVQFLADLIGWVCAELKYFVGGFLNMLASIDILGWKPFDGVGVGYNPNPGAFSSDAFTRALIDTTKYAVASTFTTATAPQLSTVDATLTLPAGASGLTLPSAATSDLATTQTSSSNVSYNGGQTLTTYVNIYTDVITGDTGGLKALALLVKKYIDASLEQGVIQ